MYELFCWTGTLEGKTFMALEDKHKGLPTWGYYGGNVARNIINTIYDVIYER